MTEYYNDLTYEEYENMDYDFYSVLEYFKENPLPEPVKANPLERMMIGTCDIYEYVKEADENGVTRWLEKLVLSGVKCRLSHRIDWIEQIPRDFVPERKKNYVLFTLPEVKIKNNSKIVVTQNGVTLELSNTGLPSYYQFHNQCELIPFERWT